MHRKTILEEGTLAVMAETLVVMEETLVVMAVIGDW
jgi:hypothetical protein